MKKIIFSIFSLFYFTTSSLVVANDQLAQMQQEIKHIVIVMLENREDGCDEYYWVIEKIESGKK